MRELRITNIEPLILDPDTGISNERTTLDYIPASRLRGAIFAALPQIAPAVKADTLLAYDGPRWSCGFPADEYWQPLRPRPRCTKKEKGHPVHWYSWDQSGSLTPASPSIELNMGVARHYGRRAHRDTALYARSALSPGQQFVAWVDSDELPTGSHEISIGTRHSANGLCNLKVSKSNGLPFQSAPRNQRHILMLLSDAIIPGKQGGYLRGLDDDAFSTELGCSVTVLAAYSSRCTVGAWSGPWGMPRESAIAIQAGSVWLVQVENSDLFEKCAKSGLGIRRFEGFGWVEIDPDYIQAEEENDKWKLKPQFADIQPEQGTPESTSERWPGLEEVPLEKLEEILSQAEAEPPPKDPGEVKRQITALTRAPNPDPCKLFHLHVLLERSKSKRAVDD